MRTNNVVISLFENVAMGNWEFKHLGLGDMMVEMDRHTSVYTQNGIARVYFQAQLVTETEIGYMKPMEFNEWLLGIEKEYN